MIMQRKRPTRLPRDRYIGERTACFDMCIHNRQRVFISSEVVAPMVERLELAAKEHGCVVPVYVFVPDHRHIMVMGLEEQSDSLATMYRFRMLAGKWLHSRGHPSWQQSFWNHVMRAGDDWRNHATYLAMNPGRAGLVENCFDYPFLGSIGAIFRTWSFALIRRLALIRRWSEPTCVLRG